MRHMSESSPLTVLTKWLDQYLNFEHLPQKNIFWLDTMEYLCSRFDHPEMSCPSFHIAGSKGKGSISMMIASILTRAGFSTGLYTSPHILEFKERVGTAQGPFPDRVYEKSVKELMNNVESIIPNELPGERPITWFELVTIFSMLCFRNAAVDWAVYEVGLGGRLDATNVIMPKCCCIGPIELEHTEFLGNTLEKIAAEKAGIIKEGVPVIIAPQTAANSSSAPESDVRGVFNRIAGERHAPIIFIEDVLKQCEYVYKNRLGNSFDDSHSPLLEGKTGTDRISIGMEIKLDAPLFNRPIHTVLQLLGSFQAYNAAVAAVAVKTVFPQIDESVIEQGLADAKLPARFEIVETVSGYSHIPALVLDGAHTVNSVHFTMDTFNRLFGEEKAYLLFACAADKDAEDIARFFTDRFDRVMLTKPGETKAADMGRLEIAFSAAGIAHETCSDFVRAIENALTKADEDRVPLLVTGSFYLVAEVKKFLLGKKCVR